MLLQLLSFPVLITVFGVSVSSESLEQLRIIPEINTSITKNLYFFIINLLIAER